MRLIFGLHSEELVRRSLQHVQTILWIDNLKTMYKQNTRNVHYRMWPQSEKKYLNSRFSLNSITSLGYNLRSSSTFGKPKSTLIEQSKFRKFIFGFVSFLPSCPSLHGAINLRQVNWSLVIYFLKIQPDSRPFIVLSLQGGGRESFETVLDSLLFSEHWISLDLHTSRYFAVPRHGSPKAEFVAWRVHLCWPWDRCLTTLIDIPVMRVAPSVSVKSISSTEAFVSPPIGCALNINLP